LSLLGLILGAPLFGLVWLIGYCDTGSPLFKQERIGLNQRLFTLIKFRTMRVNTESVATHLADASAVTSFGRFLRQTKLDELPQLWNVLRGDMSLVGPRPCLPNQHELISERASKNVFRVRPGITGLSQIQGIDMSTPALLAETDAEMLQSLTLYNYGRYIVLSTLGKGAGDRLAKS
jgi:lipopolysaccharide/colanic/teichoic acid biosynthesis glycosyltransferase